MKPSGCVRVGACQYEAVSTRPEEKAKGEGGEGALTSSCVRRHDAAAKPDEHEDAERIDGSDNGPDAHVELPSAIEERVLDILLKCPTAVERNDAVHPSLRRVIRGDVHLIQIDHADAHLVE